MQRNNSFLFDRPTMMVREYHSVHKRISRVLPPPFYPPMIPPAFITRDGAWRPPCCAPRLPPPFYPIHGPPWYYSHPWNQQQDMMYCAEVSQTVRIVKKRKSKAIPIIDPSEVQEVKAMKSPRNKDDEQTLLPNKETSIVEKLEKVPNQEKIGKEFIDESKNKQDIIKTTKTQDHTSEEKAKQEIMQKRKSRIRSLSVKKTDNPKENIPPRNRNLQKNRKSQKRNLKCKRKSNSKTNISPGKRMSRKTTRIQECEKCTSDIEENKSSLKNQNPDHDNLTHEKLFQDKMSDNNKNDNSSTSNMSTGLKRSADSIGSNEKLNKSLKFTPSQIRNKVTNTERDSKKPLSKTSTESIKSSSSESSSSASEASSSSSNTNKRTYISFNTGRSNSLECRSSSTSESSSTPNEKRRSISLENRFSSHSSQSLSSVFITPDGTPSTLDTSDRTYRSRAKRSLNDTYREDHYSPNSSLNSSAYYTPDSSPGDYESLKRFKPRWSNRSTNSDYGVGLTNDSVIQPELIGYQMVGDSQFCRFGQQLLGLQRVPTPNSPGRIGICVSGQTITDLHRRVKEKFYPISDKIILMIGTNDFLRNKDVDTMCGELESLLRTLQRSTSNIVLLTLPPIPKLCKYNNRHFQMLERYNEFIRGLEDGEKIRIADVSPLYISQPPYQKCRMELFELFFSGPNKRHDLIHLNRKGLEVIQKYILDNFL